MSTLGKCCAVAAAIFGAMIGLGFGGVGAFRLTVECFTKEPPKPEPEPTTQQEVPPVSLRKTLEDIKDMKLLRVGGILGEGAYGTAYVARTIDNDWQDVEGAVVKVSHDRKYDASLRHECEMLTLLNPESDVVGVQKHVWEAKACPLLPGRIGDYYPAIVGPRYTTDLFNIVGDALDNRDKQLNMLQQVENMQSIAFQLVSGLQYIHSKEIVHNDICLNNIFADLVVDAPPRVYLSDFGRARRLIKEHGDLLKGDFSSRRLKAPVIGAIFDAVADAKNGPHKEGKYNALNQLLMAADEYTLFRNLYMFSLPKEKIEGAHTLDRVVYTAFDGIFEPTMARSLVTRAVTTDKVEHTERLSEVLAAIKGAE